jgi:hypothetical protein
VSGRIVPTKVIRNGSIALVSAGWIVPLCGSASAVLDYLDAQNRVLISEVGHSDPFFPYIRMAGGFLGWGMFCLMGITAFWVFVVANRLWPVREADNPERLEEE